ncbi:bifunctional pantoate--beta-alanine ligase/(d)CMP kinase [Allocoleopsis sp.]|uniref:bifunctional pantoate--beta-alanine ligase/(d)CMP kinase n=1 Tax=Allocoleopsis sp. TaxID=3088169 RepID=UPI002FD58BCF
MRLFTTTAGLRCYLERYRDTADVGLVPTMGALHAGHFSLIERARQENGLVIVSIFVNPLQFGPTEDLQQYPRQLEEDRQQCERLGVDAIFAPTVVDFYGNHLSSSDMSTQVTQVVPPIAMTSVLCGRSRKGHFQGVATVVTKLLNLVEPERAYFGQKDAQQLAIIRRIMTDLNGSVEIVACPIVRDASGLALSSRNQYLTPSQKAQAPVLFQALQQAQKLFKSGDRDGVSLIEVVKSELAKASELQVEYIELVQPTTLKPLEQVDDCGLLAIAARFGTTRLIDNVLLYHRKPIVAIDGPAGAGKSTVARRVAQSLGLMHLDTGAMYRAVTWRVMEAGIDLDDEPKIAELVSQSQIYLTNDEQGGSAPTPDNSLPLRYRVWIDGEDVTQAIRSLEVTGNVSAIAAQPAVRRFLVKQQQRWGCQGGIVVEGRDIGTHVFPNAELKIFLTASVQERARRRQQDLKDRELLSVSLEQLERDIQQRDIRDSTRALAPLRKAADAIEIVTDGLSIAEVTERIVSYYRSLQESPLSLEMR